MDKKLKICHVCSYYENILFDNLVSYQSDFTDPRVFFYKKYRSGNQYNKKYIDEVECFNKIDPIFFFIKAWKAFQKYQELYDAKSFDIIYAHSLFTNGYVAYLAYKKYGTPYVVMVQNTDINTFYRVKPYLSHVANRILIHASKIIFASPSYKETLLSKHVPQNILSDISRKVTIIPYGIEDLFYNNDGYRKEIKVDHNNIHIICVGLICRNKNQVRLADAINKLNHKRYNIELTLIGKIDDKGVLSKLQSYSFVKLLPFMKKEELKKEYQKSDLFALLSITETFGLVYAEALSQGLPIVYSKGQGFDGQFDEGYVGFSADANDVNAIADVIQLAIDRKDELKKNTCLAAEKFKWNKVSELYKKLYSEVLRSRE